MSDSSPLPVGTILENNYKIIRELGQGGFARTYLAANLRRFEEKCVLKQFAPQVTANLAKAEELFEREASVMYSLNHDRIPRFREQFKTRTLTGESLFIVQDYVEGDNYWEVLDKRGQLFSEKEACEFLREILPVLEYIHSLDVIHRDISPDNIICRKADNKPILIDFGAVREAAVKYGKAMPTVVGKVGFAPDEQMRRGVVEPSSDLYALAATTLVLLTGEDPTSLYNTKLATWDWTPYVKLSSAMNKVLQKMLAYRSNNRYASASEVLAALPDAKKLNKKSPPTKVKTQQLHVTRPPNMLSRLQTLIVAPRGSRVSTPTYRSAAPAVDWGKPLRSTTKWVVFLFLVAWGGTAGWNWINGTWRGFTSSLDPSKMVNDTIANSPIKSIPDWKSMTEAIPKSLDSVSNAVNSVLPQDTVEESKILEKRVAVQKRLRKANKSAESFYKQVDQKFHTKHPELNKRGLKPTAADSKLRYEWWSLAEQMLD
jgi:serine/threonine protein kinase